MMNDEKWLERRMVGDLHRGDFREVNNSFLRMVDRAVKETAGRLGLAYPTVHWHKSGPAGGYVVDGRHQIHLNIETAGDWPRGWQPLHWLVAHELRHLWQYETGRFYGDREQQEADAEKFAIEETGYKSFNPHWIRRFQEAR
jgi:hypothetical protein